ncbi:MAG: T9SS type A sorting domain-containing protein [Ignavibacteriae bacterium]|nr:T9SS type A sorting domain-containing protein [Ignavibacteriota bacterium]
MKKLILTLLVISLFTLVNISARDFRVAQIPNGNKFSCNTCHTNGGGTPRNDFGKLVAKSFLVQSGSQFNVNWNPLLASLDADNDGVTNGQELLDPYGQWLTGSANPGDANSVTSAGLNSSKPQTTLTINFSSMTPHVGQMLYLRVYDRTDMKEVGRTSSTISENFTLTLDVLLAGHSYYIDFFADHNSNGLYDIPPTDHAWRLELPEAQGNDILEFIHNTNFTNIDWNYLLTINFTEMTPHIGQLLEIRLEDDLTSEEIIRKRIEFVPSANFTIELPGIVVGREYKIEMYADHNGNGSYDAPPTDHAYEIKFENNTGNFSTTFTHNTDFKDIGWKYLLTLNLLNMTPHDNQQIFVRVLRNDTGEEIGRKSAIIPGANFSISIPQIELGHDYKIDFFADHNGNGSYDAPPTDHAWRINFNSSTGNFVTNFIHNTSFTDIQWNDVTSVEDNVLSEIPKQFSLSQNYPNPFNPVTKIRFALPEASVVKVKIYDIIGREVATILNKNLSAGSHELPFDASNLESGVYVYRISANNFSDSKKMILMK